MAEYDHDDPRRITRNTEQAGLLYAAERARLKSESPTLPPNPLAIILAGMEGRQRDTHAEMAAALNVSRAVVEIASELSSALQSLKEIIKRHIPRHSWEKGVKKDLLRLLQEKSDNVRLKQLLEIVGNKAGYDSGSTTGYNISDFVRIACENDTHNAEAAKKVSQLVSKLRNTLERIKA